MVRLVIGSVAGAVAMFIVGLIFWATPLRYAGLSSAGEAPNAAVQLSLAQNLPHTGRYVVPDVGTPNGTILYGKGPIATVDYNSRGYSSSDPASMIGGFIQDVVVAFMIAFSLYVIAGRVDDFTTRLRVAIGLSAAASVLILLRDPIWTHTDWRFAIYALVADLAALAAASFVIVRWFLPRVGPAL
ncbi:hypothetical protein [uncultured Sphingomonas sp.]|uniref:hypothetical protein n=1 Tax=uncultured Sphingomonas sp. TaxID=158754 RepID=UPI0025CFA5C2|nr:hypothetical protein [uncultured Sphingomonas sp.]